MDCKYIASSVWLYVEGDLKPRPQQLVRRHIASCRNCAAVVREVTDSQQWLKSRETERFDDAVLDSVRRGARLKIAAMGGARFKGLAVFSRINWKPLILACPVILLMCWSTTHWVLERKRNSPARVQVADADGHTVDSVPNTKTARGTAAGKDFSERTPGRRNRKPLRRVAPEPSRPDSRDQVLAAGETRQPRPLRIEIQTEDPNVRIIWFASPGDGTVLSGPDR
jgi:hypothetical protein